MLFQTLRPFVYLRGRLALLTAARLERMMLMRHGENQAGLLLQRAWIPD